MKTLALSDQISFLSAISPAEGGAVDGATGNHAATERHDAFATILAESVGSAGKKSGAELTKATAAQAEMEADAAVSDMLELARSGAPGTAISALQGTLQNVVAVDAQNPDAIPQTVAVATPAENRLAGHEAAVAFSLLPNGAELSATAAPLASTPSESPKGEPSKALKQTRPEADTTASTVAAMVLVPISDLPSSAKGTSSEEIAPAMTGGAQANAAALASDQAPTKTISLPAAQEAQAYDTDKASAAPLTIPDKTANIASETLSAVKTSDGQESMTSSAQVAHTSKEKERAATATASDATNAGKPSAFVAVPGDQAARAETTLPGSSSTAVTSPQMTASSSAAQAQIAAEQGAALAGVANGESARQTAALMAATSPSSAGQAASAAAANTSPSVRNSSPEKSTKTEGTAQTSAAGKTTEQKPPSLSQAVSVRVLQQSDTPAASAPRESLAESRIRAALASQTASAGNDPKAQMPSVTSAADASSPRVAPTQSTDGAEATDTAQMTTAQAKSTSSTETTADMATTSPVTPSQPAALAGQSTDEQPRATRLRETKEASSVKDRSDSGAQSSGVVADASIKTADVAVAPAADKVESLSATTSGGPLSLGATGTTSLAERSAQILSGDAGTATGTHRAAASPHAIAHQMSHALADAGNRTVELTLTPEELGKVRMTLHSSDGAITVSVQAERQETLDLMRRNIDSLARDFRDMGYSNIEFDFGQQADQRPSAQQQAAAETAQKQATPDREVVARFDTTSIALQSSPRTASGGLDLRI